MKDKIKVKPIKTQLQAVNESIRIWKRLSKSPDGTTKESVVEKGYVFDCPLCTYSEYLLDKANAEEEIYDCMCCYCVWYKTAHAQCIMPGQPYRDWTIRRTRYNAERVLQFLKSLR